MVFEDKRVVVTGMGALSCVGNSVAEMWHGMLNGKSGIGPITKIDTEGFRTRIAGEIKNFDITSLISRQEARRLDNYCHYAIAATDEAVSSAALDFDSVDTDRVGVFIGSGIGGIGTFEQQTVRYIEGGPKKVSPFLIPMLIADMASGIISIRYKACGPNFSIVSACATGSHAIGEAFWTIKRGDADVMIAGGSEACLSNLGICGFSSMKALSVRNDEPERASRPFDAQRDGFVMAEGAGTVILEYLEHAKARKAPILAEMTGYGATADAHHMTAPAPGGKGAARAIEIAMEHAGIKPDDIDYINAHGTSTPLNDKFETLAIKNVLGDVAYDIPVTSTKALTGHTLGAAGAIEAIVCIQAINEGTIPGTYNYEFKDPACDLNYVPNQSLHKDVRLALNLNFGFGGHNAVLVLQTYSD